MTIPELNGHDTVEHSGHQHDADAQCEKRTFEVGFGGLLVVVDQHNGGQAEEVEEVDTDGESGEVEDEHQPAVGMGGVGIVLPLEDEPEHQGGEHRGVGIDFAFHGRKPERVAPRVGQSARHAASQDGEGLCGGLHDAISADELTRQMGDAPEEKQDAEGRKEGTHHVDPVGHLRGVGGQMREEIAGEHEEGCTRWVSHFELHGRGDELGAVPEGGGGLYR